MSHHPFDLPIHVDASSLFTHPPLQVPVYKLLSTQQKSWSLADQAPTHLNSEAYDLSLKRFESLFRSASRTETQHTSQQTNILLSLIPKPTITPGGNRASKTIFLVKLDGPLDTASKVHHLAGLLDPPPIHKGVGETGQTAHFCLINGTTKAALLSSLAHSHSHPDMRMPFTPTFIRINRAHKDLSAYSAAPTLGFDRDPTLPQFRAADPNHIYTPTQTQYPVCYFFYGTLVDPDTLAQKLALAERPVLTPAVVHGGVIKVGGGKYKGLVDGPGSAMVDGRVYEITSEEDEEQLRYYETDQYEVVRCEIQMMTREGERVKGLTFRFLGDLV